MTDEDREALERVVDRSIAGLMEHFESVQVFVSRHEPGKDGQTVGYHKGDGNWYARYGIVRDWIVKQDRNAQKDVDAERAEDSP